MIVGLMPYHPKHHSEKLLWKIRRNWTHMTDYPIHDNSALNIGPPAFSLNGMMETLAKRVEWVVTIDPHLTFNKHIKKVLEQVKNESDTDIGVVHLSVEMRGPGGAWNRFLKEIPEAARFQRLCSMWRVQPLREIGGFTDVDGRNHVPATTIRLIDAGYKYGLHAEPVAVHEDPDLTLEKWLTQMYKSGRAWTQLQLRHRGHPYMDEKTRYPMTVAQNLKAEQVAKLFWKTVACIRILGACEALGMVPQHPIPPGKVEVILE